MDMFDTVEIKQIYLGMAPEKWVIKSQVIYFTINLLGIDATANFVTVYNNQKINEPIPDSLFNKKLASSYDALANKKDSIYWEGNRPIPLESDEQKDYHVKDSMRKVVQDPKYRDSVARKLNKFRPLSLLTGDYTRTRPHSYLNVNRFLIGTDNMFNYNTVEGFNLNPKIETRFTRDSSVYNGVDVTCRYGFSNTYWNGMARLYRVNVDRRWLTRGWKYGVEAGKYVFQFNPENPVMPLFNTLSTLVEHESDLRLYERSEVAGFVRRNYGNGLSWYVRAAWQERYRLENTNYHDVIIGNESGLANNNPLSLQWAANSWEQHNAVVLSGAITWQPGFTYTQYPDFKAPRRGTWPVFTLFWQKGVSGIFNSSVNYDKWKVSVSDELDLKLGGSLSYNFATGGFINDNWVSVPDLNFVNGNRGVGLASPYLQSFQFARYYQFSNRKPLFGEAHLEYHFNGLLTNKIPLFRQLNWYLVAGANSYYVADNLYYHEAFIGLDNIGYKVARLFRVDFVQSWDSYNQHNSGLRIGLNTAALKINRSNTGSEW
ncbi:MAG: hypothetical protein EBZ77_05630 [Chitinophagia bacterium]|nr:hypothetical protein [Chitinophagia bacterium]